MNKFIIIGGMCVVEGKKITYDVAKYLKKIMDKYPDIDFIFKASFDKANRTSIDSFRGIDISDSLHTLKKIKDKLNVKVITDVHIPQQIPIVSHFVDAIQIPAFLCRQTDLLIEAGKTNKLINIKKGQFMAPDDMKHAIKKVKTTGNNKIMITERGTCFGYNNLVVDYRSFSIMKKFGYPIIYDMTHSQQKPSLGKQTGGSREFAIPMALSAVMMGIDGLFFECHPSPEIAKSDSATALYLRDIEGFIDKVMKVRKCYQTIDC